MIQNKNNTSAYSTSIGQSPAAINVKSVFPNNIPLIGQSSFDSEREAFLIIVVGKKGVGKTHNTLLYMQKYVYGDVQKGLEPRRALVFDVNNEFGQIKAISLSQLKRWCEEGRIEARRISIFKTIDDKDLILQSDNKPVYQVPTGKMSLKEMVRALYYILNVYNNGLLLVEDINKYISDSLPNDIIGALCTQRHTGVDVIIHFQTIGKFAHPKIIGNANYLRFHKVTDKVKRHGTKFDDYIEPLCIAENIINKKYRSATNKKELSFHVHFDVGTLKIKGGFSKKDFCFAVKEYLEDNYKKIVKPRLEERDLITQKLKYKNSLDLIVRLIKQYLIEYYGNEEKKVG